EDGDDSSTASEDDELATVAAYLGEDTDEVSEAKDPTQISGVNLTGVEATIQVVREAGGGSMEIEEVHKVTMSGKKLEFKARRGHYHIVTIGDYSAVVPAPEATDVGKPAFVA